MDTLVFSITNIVPIFVVILSGVLLRRLKLLTDDFIRIANKLIFTVAMPVMIFQKMRVIGKVPPELAGGTAVFVICTLLVIVVTWVIFRRADPDIRAGVVQSAFRSNLVIVGLAVIQNVMSETAVAYALVVIAVVMPLYNLFAIIILGIRTEQKISSALITVLKQVVKNPLILAIVTGLLFAVFSIPVPEVINSSMGYFSRIAIPLALICIGGSLRLSSLIKGKKYWGSAAFIKLIILPLLVYVVSGILDFSDELKAVLVIEAACPVAVVAFAMAEGFGIDSELTGEMISVTTILSIVTISVWVTVLL